MLRRRIAQLSQPQGAVGVDWLNPISRGLIGLVPGSTMRELVAGLPQGSTSVGPVTTSPAGLSAGFNGAEFATFPLRPNSVTAEKTLLVVGLVSSTTGDRSIGSLVNSGSANSIAEIYVINGATEIAYVEVGAGSSTGNISVNGGAPVGVPLVAVARTFSSTSRSLTVKPLLGGAASTATSNVSATPATAVDSIIIGAERYNGSQGVFLRGHNYLTAAWSRALTDAEIASISANPWQLFTPIARPIWVPVGASGPIVLPGQAATTATGTPGLGLSLGTTGNAATASAGSTTAGLSLSLAGNAATSSTGAVTPSLTVGLTGNAATSAAGSVTASTGGVTVGLTGTSATASTGALGAALTVGLSGNQITALAGVVTPPSGDITIGITGNAATASAGTLRVGGAAGGYDDDKPKKKRFVQRVGDKLIVFDNATDALRAFNKAQKQDDPAEPEQALEPAQATQEPAQAEQAPKPVEIDLTALRAQAEAYQQQQRLMQMFEQRNYEQMVALYESLMQRQDDEEIELLLMAL